MAARKYNLIELGLEGKEIYFNSRVSNSDDVSELVTDIHATVVRRPNSVKKNTENFVKYKGEVMSAAKFVYLMRKKIGNCTNKSATGAWWLSYDNKSIAYLWEKHCGNIPFEENTLVYLMENKGDYKIGITKDVESRITGMITAAPRIKVIAYKSFSSKTGALLIEKMLHDFFEDKRITNSRGQESEWFELAEEEIKIIKQLLS